MSLFLTLYNCKFPIYYQIGKLSFFFLIKLYCLFLYFFLFKVIFFLFQLKFTNSNILYRPYNILLEEIITFFFLS